MCTHQTAGERAKRAERGLRGKETKKKKRRRKKVHSTKYGSSVLRNVPSTVHTDTYVRNPKRSGTGAAPGRRLIWGAKWSPAN